MGPVQGLGDSEDLAGLFRQAAEMARSGIYDRALDLYLRILEERPDHAPTLVNAARIHFIRGRTGEAIEFLSHANRVAPGNPRTLGYLGMAEAKAGRLEEAMAHLEDSQLLDGSRIDVGNDLAAVYFQLDRYDDAADAWKRMLALDPENPRARAGLEEVRRLTQPAESGHPSR